MISGGDKTFVGVQQTLDHCQASSFRTSAGTQSPIQQLLLWIRISAWSKYNHVWSSCAQVAGDSCNHSAQPTEINNVFINSRKCVNVKER